MATHVRDDADFKSLSLIAQAALRPVSFKGMAVMPIASLKKMLPHKVILAKNLSALLDSTIETEHKNGILYSEAVREFKKRFVLHVLDVNGGNQCRAARELGMHRNTLSRLLDEFRRHELKEEGRKRPRRAGIVPGQEYKFVERGK